MIFFNRNHGSLLGFLATASIVTNLPTLTHGHGIEVRECITPTGQLRFFVETWHYVFEGARPGPPYYQIRTDHPKDAGTMQIQFKDISAGSPPSIQAKYPNGLIVNKDIRKTLTGWGCINDSAPTVIHSCHAPHESHGYTLPDSSGQDRHNWVYYERSATCNTEVEYTLKSGDTLVLTDGCRNLLYPAVIRTTFNDNSPPVPQVIIGGTTHDLPYTIDEAFIADGTAGTALVNFDATAGDDCDDSPIITVSGDTESNMYAVGVHVITVEAKDDKGNIHHEKFTFTVIAAPTASPSSAPSGMPSTKPSFSSKPSSGPSANPSISTAPSDTPSLNPSISSDPSSMPSTKPSVSTKPSSQPSSKPSVSSAPTNHPSLNPSISSSPSSVPSNEPSISGAPSNMPSGSPSVSSKPSSVPSTKPSISTAPSESPSSIPTTEPSLSPSLLPSLSSRPSITGSLSPSVSSAPSVSKRPSDMPSGVPSISSKPSVVPSLSPSVSFAPSGMPSDKPSTSTSPSENPSLMPSISGMPSSSPSANPSVSSAPTSIPSANPSVSSAPSGIPSSEPSVSGKPSSSPSSNPSVSSVPTNNPSLNPSVSSAPSGMPSNQPSISSKPSSGPSAKPSVSTMPSKGPSNKPSISTMPSGNPSSNPSISTAPSSGPSENPSVSTRPSLEPTLNPSVSSKPSEGPSESPSISVEPSNLPTGEPSISTEPSTVPSLSPSISARPSLNGSMEPSISTEPSSAPSALGSIGPNVVFNDEDEDGVKDENEDTLPGVNVTLWCYDENDEKYEELETVLTDSEGMYEFTQVAPAQCYIQVTPSVDENDDYVFSPIDNPECTTTQTCNQIYPNGTSPVITVNYNENVEGPDVGIYLPLSQIGPSVVFNDLNKDGLQDEETEPPLVGVSLVLMCDGEEVDSDITGVDGMYMFDDVHPAEECHVAVTPEVNGNDNYVFSPTPDCTGQCDLTTTGCTWAQCNEIEPDGTSPSVSVGYDETIDAWSVGLFLPLSTIGPNIVFNDMDNDGVHDLDEPPVENVPISLVCGGEEVANTISNANGTYEFTNVQPGECYIQVTPTDEDFTFSPVMADGNQIDPETGTSPSVTIGYNETISTWDVGMHLPPATIGPNRVFNDRDGDGQRDPNESLLVNVTVNLYCYHENGTAILTGTKVTDANGEYVFNDVQPGACYIQVNPLVDDDDYAFSPINPNCTTECNQIQENGTSSTVDIDWNDVIDNWDVGMYQPVILGNKVWEDGNGNGIQDEGEAGTVGLLVSLVDANGDTVDTTLTGADGSYWFTDLAPGTYGVEFNLPPDYVFASAPPPLVMDPGSEGSLPSEFLFADIMVDTTRDISETVVGTTPTQVLISGENNTSFDAGIYIPVTVGGIVWDDLNGNGIMDQDEPPLGEAMINIIDDELNTHTATSETDGRYTLKLPPGTYFGSILLPDYSLSPLTAPGVANGNDFDPLTYQTSSMILSSGESGVGSFDAGFYKLATIESYIWDDANANGIQDPEEGPFTGPMAINLYSPNSTEPIMTTTDVTDGNFQLPYIPPGEYVIEFVPAENSGKAFTLQDAGNDDSKDSDVDPITGRAPLTIVSGQDITNVAAGVTSLPSIGPNKIFKDDNADGVYDDGEEGLPNIQVLLYDLEGNVAAVAFTDINGDYEFSALVPGDYYISVNKDPNYNHSPVVVGGNQVSSDENVEFGNSSPTITLALGDSDTSLLVGMWEPVVLGNKVWNDLNGDGVQQAGEPGMEGVSTILTDGNGNQINTTETDSDGHYYFMGMAPADFAVTFMLPEAFIFTVPAKRNVDIVHPTHPDGSLAYNDVTSDVDRDSGRTDIKSLKSGEENYSFDAGMFIPVTINGTIWHDLNANGVEEGEEPGLPYITVELFDRDADSFGTTLTDVNGVWIFDEMPPGTYHVKIIQSDDYRISPKPDLAADDSSDFDPETWMSAPTYFESGSSSDGLFDAGLYLPVTIGDRVWFDELPNGIQDQDEGPFDQPLTINLRDELDYVVQETVSATGGSGFYQFTDVIPGTYTLEFILDDDDYKFTVPNAGNITSVDSDVSPITGRVSITVTSGEKNLDIDAGVMDVGLYYPEWDTDIQVCTNDGLDASWLAAQEDNYLYRNKEDCCLTHFWWRMTQCMANEEFKFVAGDNGECETKIFFEDWEDNSPSDWTLTTQFDTVQDCCANEFWFGYDDCIGKSPVIFKFEFCVDVLGLVDPADCQSADIYANVLEDAVNEGCHHAFGLEGVDSNHTDHDDRGRALVHPTNTISDAYITRIGGVSLEKIDGSSVCGGTLGGQGFTNELTGTAPDIEGAVASTSQICGVISVEEKHCKEEHCLREIYEVVVADLSHFVDEGDLTLAINRRSASRLPPVPELQQIVAMPYSLSHDNLLLPGTVTGELDWKYFHGSDLKTCMKKSVFLPNEKPYDTLIGCCEVAFHYNVDGCCEANDDSCYGSAGKESIASVESTVANAASATSDVPLLFYPTWISNKLCDSKTTFEDWEVTYTTLSGCCDENYPSANENKNCKNDP